MSDISHLELAVLFLAHSTSFFLKPQGKTIFVLPRSILNADHHANIRSGQTCGFDITEIWDLQNVSPLFRVPACVLFVQQETISGSETKLQARIKYTTPISGYLLKGRMEKPDTHWEQAQTFISTQEVMWRYIELGRHSAFAVVSRDEIIQTTKANDYCRLFKAGVCIIPRCFYFISLQQPTPPDWKDRILHVKTQQLDEAKPPWKNISLQGEIASKFFFRTALAKNVVPFGLIQPTLIILPIHLSREEFCCAKEFDYTSKINNDTTNSLPIHTHSNRQEQNIHIILWDIETLVEQGYLETAKWFRQTEQVWKQYRTATNSKVSAGQHLNWQKGLTSQNLSQRYIVIYTASAKDANTTIVDRMQLDLPFVADCKTYWFSTDNLQEAYYLAGFLNSNYANLAIKAFQTTGLFGPRDIHKRILDVPLTSFSQTNPQHIALAQIAQDCIDKISQKIQEIGTHAYQVGKLRSDIRKQLTPDLAKIDTIVKRLVEEL